MAGASGEPDVDRAWRSHRSPRRGERVVNGVFVHESSVVDPGAVVGSGTRIWHFCHVMSRARIGARCSLGQNVFVADDGVIRDNGNSQKKLSLYPGPPTKTQ